MCRFTLPMSVNSLVYTTKPDASKVFFLERKQGIFRRRAPLRSRRLRFGVGKVYLPGYIYPCLHTPKAHHRKVFCCVYMVSFPSRKYLFHTKKILKWEISNTLFTRKNLASNPLPICRLHHARAWSTTPRCFRRSRRSSAVSKARASYNMAPSRSAGHTASASNPRRTATAPSSAATRARGTPLGSSPPSPARRPPRACEGFEVRADGRGKPARRAQSGVARGHEVMRVLETELDRREHLRPSAAAAARVC